MPEVPSSASVLLREYDTLRSEISDRMKTAFSHLGYIGAIIIFGFPYTVNITFQHTIAATFGLAILFWISIVNWFWLRRCAEQIREIEERVDKIYGESHLLTWERKAKKMTNGILNLPGNFIKFEELDKIES